MLLTITTEHRPATDLGYLLHKNPGRVQETELAFGRTHLFYPEATEERCTFALLLDLDPVALVRGGGGQEGGLLDQYVNDRPYVASPFLSVAMASSLRTALNGRCDQRPGLVQQAIPLGAAITPLPVRGDASLVERLFRAPSILDFRTYSHCCRTTRRGGGRARAIFGISEGLILKPMG
jgi:hypothetical protein